MIKKLFKENIDKLNLPLIFFYGTTQSQVYSFIEEIRKSNNLPYKRIVIFSAHFCVEIEKLNLDKSIIEFINLNNKENLINLFYKIYSIIKREKLLNKFSQIIAFTEIVYSHDWIFNIFISLCKMQKIKIICISHGPYIFSGSSFCHDKGWSPNKGLSLHFKNIFRSIIAYVLHMIITKKIIRFPNLNLMKHGLINMRLFDNIFSFGDNSILRGCYPAKNILLVKPSITKFLLESNFKKQKPTLFLITSGSHYVKKSLLAKLNEEIYKQIIKEYNLYFSSLYSLVLIGKEREIENLRLCFKNIKIVTRQNAKQDIKDRFILPLCSGALIELAEHMPKSLCIPYVANYQVHYKVKSLDKNNFISEKNPFNKNLKWSTAREIVYQKTNLGNLWGLNNKKSIHNSFESFLEEK